MRKVLVVEDEVLIRLSIVDALHEAGFKVLDVGNAEDAMEIVNKEAINFLLTDIQLPGKLTGIDLAYVMAERFPDAGIIVVSGRLTSKDITLPSGAEFFSKPYSFERIIARLKVMTEH